MNGLSAEILTKAVRRNNKYNDVVTFLVFGGASNKIFSDIKDLIIFAAMVGKRFGIREALEGETTPIILQTFAGAGSGKDGRVDQHNILFMFSLIEHQDMNYIRDEKIGETIGAFEEYSNGGLSKIKDWLEESAWNPSCLIDQMVDVLKESQLTGIQVGENPF